LKATTKKVVNFLKKKMHPGDLAGGCSDLKMAWLHWAPKKLKRSITGWGSAKITESLARIGR